MNRRTFLAILAVVAVGVTALAAYAYVQNIGPVARNAGSDAVMMADAQAGCTGTCDGCPMMKAGTCPGVKNGTCQGTPGHTMCAAGCVGDKGGSCVGHQDGTCQGMKSGKCGGMASQAQACAGKQISCRTNCPLSSK